MRKRIPMHTFAAIVFAVALALSMSATAWAGNWKLTITDQEQFGAYPIISVYNPVDNNLYIGNNEAYEVSVYSLDKKRFINPIATTLWPWKLILSLDGTKLYVTDSYTGTDVIDLQSGQVTTTLTEAFKEFYADSQTDYIYGRIRNSQEIQRLDTTTDIINSTGIILVSTLEGKFQIDPQKRRLYNVRGYYSDYVDVYDLDTLALQDSYYTGTMGYMKLNPRANRLYSASTPNWKIIDTETGANLGTLTTDAWVNRYCGNCNLENLRGLLPNPDGCGTTNVFELFDQFSGAKVASIELPDAYCTQTYAVSTHPSLNKFFVVADNAISGNYGILYVIDVEYQE